MARVYSASGPVHTISSVAATLSSKLESEPKPARPAEQQLMQQWLTALADTTTPYHHAHPSKRADSYRFQLDFQIAGSSVQIGLSSAGLLDELLQVRSFRRVRMIKCCGSMKTGLAPLAWW